MFDLRLINADVLILRRRRGLLALAFLLTVGAAVLIYTVTALQHGAYPIKYGPAGGLKHYRDSINFLNAMVFVVAALVGATAGAADIESGVFRDLCSPPAYQTPKSPRRSPYPNPQSRRTSHTSSASSASEIGCKPSSTPTRPG